MFDFLVILLFGWPAVITSVLLSVAGLFLKKPLLLMAAGIICVPFTYYISGGFRSPALVLPLFQFGSAYLISSQKILAAWTMLLPLVMISAVLAYVVLTQ